MKRMRLIILRKFAICLFVAISIVTAQAQSDEYGRWINGITEPWFFDSHAYTKKEAAEFQKRWKQMEAENGLPSENEWAGDYTVDDGVGTRLTVLRWSPKTGFVFASVYTCLPNVTSLNYGRVIASASLIELRPEVTAKRAESRSAHAAHSGPPMKRRFVPAKWGERHYLVQENRIKDFYDFVAGVGAYRPGAHFFIVEEGFLLKSSDADKAVEGMPVLPPGYERYVKKPVDASVVAVGKSYIRRVRDSENPWWNELVTPVKLDVGSVHGVRRGMAFNVLSLGENDQGEIVKVTRARRHTSSGVIVRSVKKKPGEKVNEWDDGKEIAYPKINVGWRLSTSHFK